MKASARSGQVAFRPRARIMKLIGSELISDEVVAITELVKNSHDADAGEVTIDFRGVTEESGGEILISDDGTGMNLDALVHRWMEPANSWKRKAKKTTGLGRRVLGEKGVGRFATDKLGSELELISRQSSDRNELRALFDWDRFDEHDRMLHEVKCKWEKRPASVVKRYGTVLRISGLRHRWTERSFRRLSTRLARLISPFDSADDFKIIIRSDEFPEYSGRLRPDFLDRAPYRIDAIFDGRGQVSVRLNKARAVKHRWNGAGTLECGPVRIRLFAFDLETEAIGKVGPRMEVRSWLKEWSGASMYRDGFRIWPYGEPHDDWLRLDQRRVNNPVVRLSNNQLVGFVQITSDRNPELRDQTNREGLIHNRAFDDLRRLMYFVLQILEAERQSIRHPVRRSSPGDAARKAKAEETITRDLERLTKRASSGMQDQLRSIGRRLEETLDRERSQHRRTVQGYSELAALGQAAMGIEGTVTPLLSEILTAIEGIRDNLTGKRPRAITSRLTAVEGVVEALKDRVRMIRPLESGATAKARRTLDVRVELERFRDMHLALLEQAGVEMDLDLPGSSMLRIEMKLESFYLILQILMNNSLDWLHARRSRRIQISSRSTGDRCEIVFSDSGPGIPAELAEKVFEPLFSRKEQGRGMGLAIARDLVEQYYGTIEVLQDKGRRGASLRLLLPRKKSRARTGGNR